MKKIIVLGIALLVFITGCGAEPEQKWCAQEQEI